MNQIDRTLEEQFANKLKELYSNSNAELTDQETDRNDHIDVIQTITYDVKSIKKLKRSDNETNENFNYVELKNVNGEIGWLYSDKTDYFSFETDDYWVIVNKQHLQEFIADKCKDKLKSEKPELYKLYTRKDRKDIVVLVKTIDLCKLATTIIDK